jgi:hypothetical protein
MSTITYGQTQQQQDETLCKTQNRFNLKFSGRGTINTSGSLTFRLKRENGAQAFYIPEQTSILLNFRAVLCNATDAYVNVDGTATDTLEHIVGAYVAYRDLAGNVTIGIDPATPQTEAVATIVPTANTTVQGFEILVTALDAAASSVQVFVEIECFCINENEALVNFPAGATAALTAAE